MDYSKIILKLLSCPNITSKHWVFQQYDHEVGIRTVVKPGFDASVLRLDNGKFLSAKIDGNPKHCYLDPRQGAIGCFEEACRNVVCRVQIQLEWLIIFNLVILRIQKYSGHLWNHLRD